MNDVLRDVRERGWFHLDNAIIDEYLPRIGVTAFAVYACIVRHSDQSGAAFPSYSTLQKEVGCGRSQVAAAIKKIVDAGLVTISTGKRASNHYHIVTVSTSPGAELVSIRNQSQSETGTSSESELVEAQTSPGARPELVPIRDWNNTQLTREIPPPIVPPTEKRAAKPPTTRGTRIPPDFALTPRLYAYAADKGVTAAEADLETEEFKLYWESASGNYALKTDWDKTWMRRILDQVTAAKIGPARRNGVAGYGMRPTNGQPRNPDGTPRLAR